MEQYCIFAVESTKERFISTQPSQLNQPPYPPLRPRQSGVAIACILSGGLIAAAIINSHHPVAPVVVASGSGAAMLARATPPIAQESAQQQFEQQINEQSPKSIKDNGVEYYFRGVKNVSASYDAKEDVVNFEYTPQWQSNAGTDNELAESLTSAQAVSDGYGHYKGEPDLCGLMGIERKVRFVIR